ncbi:MAG: hypothetical protein C5B60_11175 [Chloroflexi bacterium]|nr:MAG: hypothetical protein C5B60_11175 [Chloroflexota bacterium]
MGTVVQTDYAPQIRAGVNGLIADEVDNSVQTYVVETAAGIGFGLAVSQGVNDIGCIVGGTLAKFLGITRRDMTLALAPVDPLSSTPLPLDTYGQRTNAGVMSRGHMWVVPGATVAAADPVYFVAATGQLTNSASGTAATGSVAFTSQPNAGNTLTIQGTVVTFVASGATGAQVNIGPTLGDTIRNLVTMLNASADVNLVLMSYAGYPPSPGGAPQGSGMNTLQIAVKAVGVAGNAYTLATNVPGATLSGATLSGGSAAAIGPISGARWYTSALAGLLAVVSLGIQT